MGPRTRSILTHELAGAACMVVAGSALHFLFELSGGWRPVALIAAVNESVWEHLKLAFWPGLFWALIARPPAGLRRGEVLAAKGLSLLVTAVLIVVIFASYTAVLGRNLLALDIGTFVAAILVGQALSFALLSGGADGRHLLLNAGLLLLALQLLAYSLFTFVPPDHWLFVEERSGLRGLPVP